MIRSLMEYPFRTGFVFWEAQGLFCQFLSYIEKMIFKCCTLFRQRLLCKSLSHLSNANGRPKSPHDEGVVAVDLPYRPCLLSASHRPDRAGVRGLWVSKITLIAPAPRGESQTSIWHRSR